MMEIVVPMLTAGATAAVYGVYGYLTGQFGGNAGEWDPYKLAGTALVGFGFGFVATWMGMPIDQATVIGALATVGAVEVGQKILKPLYNKLMAWVNKPITP